MTTPRISRGLYHITEAAIILNVTPPTLRRWLYHPAYRAGFTHLLRRNGDHPRRYRLLTTDDVDRLAYLILTRGLTTLERAVK